jgi:hypothetical protein
MLFKFGLIFVLWLYFNPSHYSLASHQGRCFAEQILGGDFSFPNMIIETWNVNTPVRNGFMATRQAYVHASHQDIAFVVA